MYLHLYYNVLGTTETKKNTCHFETTDTNSLLALKWIPDKS